MAAGSEDVSFMELVRYADACDRCLMAAGSEKAPSRTLVPCAGEVARPLCRSPARPRPGEAASREQRWAERGRSGPERGAGAADRSLWKTEGRFTIRMDWITKFRLYRPLEMVSGQEVGFDSNALNFYDACSEFRPAHRVEECFYRSFIFSYVEKVLGTKDKHDEHHLFVAVKGVARQHVCLGWASESSRGQKVMRWKTHDRWNHVPSNSYRKEKLLDFFNVYEKTDDIFAILRLVAAIWKFSLVEEYETFVPELNEDILMDQCFNRVIQHMVFTDHVQIQTLGIPLRVEYLFQEAGQGLCNRQDHKDDMARSMCWPRHHQHLLPPDREVNCNIICLRCPDDLPVSAYISCFQQADHLESPNSESPSQDIYGVNRYIGDTTVTYADHLESPNSESPSQHIYGVNRYIGDTTVTYEFKRKFRSKGSSILEPTNNRQHYVASAAAAARISSLIFSAVCKWILDWLAAQCFNKRTNPSPPLPEFSWFAVMGSPILNEDGSCTISACIMCVEAQHRLSFERLHGKGTFPCKAKAVGKFKDMCLKRGIWSSEAGSNEPDILHFIIDKGGVLTTRDTNSVRHQIDGYHCWEKQQLKADQFVRLLYSRGPVLGSLWVEGSVWALCG
ncbi:hypothetical protein U9M48_033684 [Paspalum notatum var. saurae]|uniref:Uncharacterized protein n=1 Tax=Paspalum notatum var. saurae TaxID=547442 RepID=A0AAQ3X6G4_PASNO